MFGKHPPLGVIPAGTRLWDSSLANAYPAGRGGSSPSPGLISFRTILSGYRISILILILFEIRMYLTNRAERMLGQPERIAKSLTIDVFIGLLKQVILEPGFLFRSLHYRGMHHCLVQILDCQ